jgi:hypothetical protein
VLDFSHRGWLYEESFLFYDEKTDSLWVQATGESVHGDYKGTRLERLPATHTTWGQWRRQHPDTLVLGQRPDEKFRFAEDSYAGYYAEGGGIRHKKRGPLHFGIAVFGVVPDVRLYPLADLEGPSFVADRLGDLPVLVVYHAPSRTAVAFERRHAGRELEFDPAKVTETDVILKDRQTGSTWSGVTGRCLSGPSRGERLRQLNSTQFVQENWKLHYPRGRVYR